MYKCLLLACLLLLDIRIALAQQNNNINCNNFLSFPDGIAKTQAQFSNSPEQFVWQWFVCLNTPSQINSKNRQWESFKPSDQVYLANGATPLPYNQSPALPTSVINRAKNLGMDLNRTLHFIDSIQQVDGLILQMGGAVPQSQRGKPVRFQLLMAQDTFDYIVQKGVYNTNGQAALTSSLNFPASAWELKTSWIWIGQDPVFQQTLQNNGYYIGQAYFQNSDKTYTVGYAALSGMHVINKLFPAWIWSTFENINNSQYTVTNGAPAKPMTNTTGPTAAATAQNSIFQKNNPGLSRYQLIGVQTQTNNNIVPTLLANSQLESAFQTSSSCLACHSTAAYSTTQGYFNFALQEKGGIVYPTALLPPSKFVGYQNLDFVWSLKRAQWKR